MKPYSEDLRRKIVEAVGRGMSKTAAAQTFGVSRSSVKRYVGAATKGEPLAPKRHPGSRPKLDERARKLLEADVERRPVASLKERCLFLRAAAGVSVSESTVSRLLRRMGFTQKNGAWARASATSS
jgi:transposase